jgi:outer membrane protein assembly factor BamB
MLHSRRLFLAQSASLVTGGIVAHQAFADDWPQWRGLNRDGVWHEDDIVDTLPTPEMPIVWRASISAGYSGPSVANGKVYVTDRLEQPTQIERVHCFDSETGKSVWTYQYDCPYTIQYPAGPRATVSVVDNIAYSLGSMGHLHAINASNGEVLWLRDLATDFDVDMPIWGISASPLIAHNLIVTQVGGKDGACIVAVDAKSGKNVWKALQERAQYSAPVLIRQSNRDVVVVWTGDSISGLDLPTGQVLWHVDFPVSRMPIGVATPVVNGDRIFVTSFYDGSMMVQFDPNELTAKKLWHEMGPDEQHTKALHSIISTPVFEGDHIYGVDSYGELRCLDAKTGKRIWEDRTATPRDRWSTIHFVQRNGHTWMLNEAGDLIVANLTPKGYEELSRSHLLMPTQAQLSRRGGKGVCWSHPAFANRHIYARNDQELICASLAI